MVGLGHRIAWWYMVMKVLEENFCSFYTDHKMMEAVDRGHTVCADHSYLNIIQLSHIVAVCYKTCEYVKQ